MEVMISQDNFTVHKPNNEYIPFTLLMVGNNPPLFPVDEAIKRRIQVYKFIPIWEKDEAV